MKILISGICGFVGSRVASTLVQEMPDLTIVGFDNFSRAGSHLNRDYLSSLGIKVIHADVRQHSDIDSLPRADWLIDAAANPSILAGVDGMSSSRQLLENNLYGTVNLLEYTKRHQAGFILLSTSRVYSIDSLRSLPMTTEDNAFKLLDNKNLPEGVSASGIAESFSTEAPISLYGSTKLCSELLALEYATTFSLPVWINRCGVLAGAGQFGRPDQGIFTYWINAYLRRKPMKYIGHGGSGYQLRDAMHPRDLCLMLKEQMNCSSNKISKVCNLGGGITNSMSLAQLSNWCNQRFGFTHKIAVESEERAFDVPWIVMDSSFAEELWGWEARTPLSSILEEIATHAENHPDWLEVSSQ